MVELSRIPEAGNVDLDLFVVNNSVTTTSSQEHNRKSLKVERDVFTQSGKRDPLFSTIDRAKRSTGFCLFGSEFTKSSPEGRSVLPVSCQVNCHYTGVNTFLPMFIMQKRASMSKFTALREKIAIPFNLYLELSLCESPQGPVSSLWETR